LAFMNSVAMNIPAQILVWVPVFSYFKSTPRIGIAK
jgi:hypothetical protein